MTQKEIDKLVANTIVYVAGKRKEIQEKLFSLGYCWHVGGSTEVKHENEPFLFIYKVHSISCTNDMCTFMRSEYREISAEEILALELNESDYRPFKSKEECWNEMLKHQPFGWIISNKFENFEQITYVSPNLISLSDSNLSFSTAFDKYKFADGSPFGIKEE